MPYTNPDFESLSNAERDAQMAQIGPLLMKHATELFTFGTIDRTISSRAKSNRSRETMPPSEVTDMRPFRTSAWNLATSQTERLLADLGGPEHLPPAAALADRRAGNYVYRLQRTENLDGMYLSMGDYVVGLVLSPGFAKEHKQYSRFLPIMDCIEEDVMLIDRQLDEVAAFAMDHKLTAIDPVTLLRGAGELQMPEEQ